MAIRISRNELPAYQAVIRMIIEPPARLVFAPGGPLARLRSA
ncbi:hypothetical protein AruPA_19920 [Acidiphilium sp. PA]|nr:hypothetical protein [Acidiphilium sp. PA]MCW8309297.1 hypothetical protein [Acidiphilium sp. PA]